MDKQQAATQQDFNELTEFFESERKRFERMRRVGEALSRIASIANAGREVEAQHVEATRRLAEQQAELEAAEQSVERAKRDGEAILAKARSDAQQIIDQARSESESESVLMKAALQAKRDELAAVSARLNRARELLG